MILASNTQQHKKKHKNKRKGKTKQTSRKGRQNIPVHPPFIPHGALV
jgi:nitrate reductase cytochrome c-type subunit